MKPPHAMLLTLAALGVLLTGCGSTAPAPSVSVDGEPVDLGENPGIECRSEDESLFIFITPEEPASETHGVTVQFTPGDGDAQDALEVVAYEDAAGDAVIYQKGLGQAPAVTQDGATYAVTGSGRNVDAGQLPDGTETRTFEIAATCP